MVQPKIIDNGRNNAVIGEPELIGVGARDANTVIEFNGNNCSIEFGPNVRLRKTCRFFFHGDNQHIKIAGNNRLTVAIHMKRPGSKVSIGKGTNNNGIVWMLLGEPDDQIIIGERCLFASARLRTSDSHPIFDATSGDRINPSAPIIIGDHVWIGEEAQILGGAKIGAGSVIGTRATVVAGEIPEACIAVGTPARAVKHNIKWSERMDAGDDD